MGDNGCDERVELLEAVSDDLGRQNDRLLLLIPHLCDIGVTCQMCRLIRRPIRRAHSQPLDMDRCGRGFVSLTRAVVRRGR